MKFTPEPVVRLTCTSDIQDFVEDAIVDPNVATTVIELTITLRTQVPLQTLRECLSMVSNVEDLILWLPPDFPEDVLVDIFLPRLQLFKTNLSHHRLLQFLATHFTITDLCLDACGRDEERQSCPLRNLDLRHVQCVEAAFDCVPALAHSALFRLTAEEQRYRSSNGPSILKSLASPLTSLSVLMLDFYPNDYNILQAVVRAAPKIQKLTLFERPQSSRRQMHARRAWNDARSWATCLFQLPWLEELAVRTASFLIHSPRGVEGERKTLQRWVTRTSRTGNREHPTLTSLRIWYRTGEPQGGVLTLWSKSSGAWENILRAAPPSPNTLF